MLIKIENGNIKPKDSKYVTLNLFEKKTFVFQHTVLSRVKRSIRELCPFLSKKSFYDSVSERENWKFNEMYGLK